MSADWTLLLAIIPQIYIYIYWIATLIKTRWGQRLENTTAFREGLSLALSSDLGTVSVKTKCAPKTAASGAPEKQRLLQS